MGGEIDVSGGTTSPSCPVGAGAITADCQQLRALAVQLQLAANLTSTAAASVRSGLNLGDVVLAGALDPTGVLDFEAAVAHVLAGPFGLDGLEDELAGLGSKLSRAAGEYLGLDGQLSGTIALARSGAELVAQLTDGRARVTAIGPVGDETTPPRDLNQLMSTLAALDRDRDPDRGEIDVQTLDGTDAAGRPVRKVIVYVPGTETLLGPNATNLGADILAVDGQRTTYESGVLQAMRDAGVRNTDDVMIVGHSLGGLIAVNAARDAMASGEFNVTHVITAGAPIGESVTEMPTTTQVLAIETTGDPIPALDGRPNPSWSNVTTATVHSNLPGLLTDHGLDASYLAATAAVEADPDAAIQTYLAGATGYFTQDEARSERYSITRVY